MSASDVQDVDGDSCYDVVAAWTLPGHGLGGGLTIPCANVWEGSTVAFKTFFGWKSPGEDDACEDGGAVPGGTSVREPVFRGPAPRSPRGVASRDGPSRDRSRVRPPRNAPAAW